MAYQLIFLLVVPFTRTYPVHIKRTYAPWRTTSYICNLIISIAEFLTVVNYNLDYILFVIRMTINDNWFNFNNITFPLKSGKQVSRPRHLQKCEYGVAIMISLYDFRSQAWWWWCKIRAETLSGCMDVCFSFDFMVLPGVFSACCICSKEYPFSTKAFSRELQTH
jgi:hypothetical protein